ncbi:chemokine-like factor isoform X4 [Herpailurus yagouaroundi]|uniref:chemokine-like factor isoform X4 n=1 Tax=Herpailurus yagouaroundi TaxID=1608482 RepID=UPI001AD756DB|nr:chemokine-like factor isoform X4 [Puma yagouaroundi]
MQTLKQKHRPFCFSVKGQVKMLRLALTVTSMAFFIIAQAPEPYIVITGFEVAVIFFFIILYMLRLDRLIDCLFWPLLVSLLRPPAALPTFRLVAALKSSSAALVSSSWVPKC